MSTFSRDAEFKVTALNYDKLPTGPEVKTIIYINDEEYDVTSWKMKHPGGHTILEKYHEKDATDVFYAFHSRETIENIRKYQRKKCEYLPVVDDRLKHWRELRERVEKEGLLKPTYGWLIYKTITTLLQFVLAVYLMYSSYWLLSAVIMGIFWQQAGWLSHEYAHHQGFMSRRLNNMVVYLSSNVLQGFSVNWWKERHNTHHAITNVLEIDPDVKNLPLFVWDTKDIPYVSPNVEGAQSDSLGIFKYLITYQAYYWIPFTPFLRIIWEIESFRYAINLKNDLNTTLRKTYLLEFGLIIVHHLMILTLLRFSMPSFSYAVAWWLLSNGIGGALIAWIVFTSHYACELFDPNQRLQLNFVDLQLYTTRNIEPGIFMDWFAGGLNYQIEHHLFPQMPRCNLYRCSKIVRLFCKENKLPYQSESLLTCIKLILMRLAQVGAAWRKQVLQ